MLRAISELKAGILVTPQTRRLSSCRAMLAERRQYWTLMFCDLVGSSALSVRLDPEDLRAVIGAYHDCIAKVIGRNDGVIVK